MRKECLNLSRDKGGLAILFLMPVALVTIMAWVQHAPFRNYQETNIPLLLVNNDQDTLGMVIERGLTESNIFNVNQSVEGQALNAETLRQKVSSGEFPIGIVIPEGATAAVDSNAHLVLDQVLGKMGIKQQRKSDADSVSIVDVDILLDPATKRSFKNTLLSAMDKYVAQIEQRFLMEALSSQLTSLLPQKERTEELDIPQYEFIRFRQTYASSREAQPDLETNSVQHNVPAWTLFGMFFIVIPLAGSMIKERDDGSIQRLMTMPVPYITILGGKLWLYFLVCIIQFLLMVGVGYWLLPALGLPELEVVGSWGALIVMAIVASLAAVGYGIMVGTLFRTHAQATTFGSVSVVILAAIGGIWVPMYVMPHALQTLSTISPLAWGMNGFNDVFLRSGGIDQIGGEVAGLVIFAIATLAIAVGYQKLTRSV